MEIGYTVENIVMPNGIHLMSERTPVQEPAVAPWAAEVVRKARAIGLSDESPEFPQLTFTMVLDVAERVARAGIAEHAVARLLRAEPSDLEAVAASLRQIDTLIEESPVPDSEWPRLIDVLGREELAGLLGISASSAHRYERGQRDTPDAVAARLHWLALVVGDLEGAYNQVGIRRWFHRRRTPLDGRTPAQLLEGDWDPDDPKPSRVRDLARSLIVSGAT
jgi:transcriptional regulator with XRE-family HTH domain